MVVPNKFYSASDLRFFEESSSAKQVYAILEQNGELLAGVCGQIVHFTGERLRHYEPDFSGPTGRIKKAAVCAALRQVDWKILIANNLLVTGCKPYRADGASAPEPEIIEAMYQEIAQYFGVKTIMFSDLQDEDRSLEKTLENLSYKSFYTEDEMRVPIDPNWNSFEDYLNSLSSKYRVRYRKYSKKSKDLISKDLSLDEITHYKDSIDELFREVEHNLGFAMTSPVKDYFLKLKQNLGDRVKILAYFKGEEMVAFSSFFIHPNSLENHYIGMKYEMNEKLGIFHRLLYDSIDLAITLQKESVGFGRTAPEIKSAVGAKPFKMKAFIRNNNPINQMVIRFIANRLKPEPWIQRNPFKKA